MVIFRKHSHWRKTERIKASFSCTGIVSWKLTQYFIQMKNNIWREIINNLAVISWYIRCFLSPGLYGSPLPIYKMIPLMPTSLHHAQHVRIDVFLYIVMVIASCVVVLWVPKIFRKLFQRRYHSRPKSHTDQAIMVPAFWCSEDSHSLCHMFYGMYVCLTSSRGRLPSEAVSTVRQIHPPPMPATS